MTDKQVLHIREYFPSEKSPSSSSWVLAQTQSIQKYGFSPLVMSPTPIMPKTLARLFRFKHAWKQEPDNTFKDYLGVKVMRPGYYKLPNKYFLNYNVRAMGKTILKNAHKLNYGLIHAHFGHAGVASLELKRVSKKPLITSFYGFDLGSDLQGLRKSYQVLAKEGDLFLALSDDMKKDLIFNGFPERKIDVHHLGVDTQRFIPSQNYNPFRDELVFLIVAGFHERKGIHHAIQAFKLAKDNNPSLRMKLHIVGDGSYKNVIMSQIGNDKDIYVLNNHIADKPREMVLNEMQNCDVFMLTSQTMGDGDKEGTPVVLMEAQACAKPCISTIHAGIPEVVIDGKTGILVEERDVDAISNAIVKMASDVELRLEMGKNARKHILESFNHVVQMDRLNEIYCRFN